MGKPSDTPTNEGESRNIDDLVNFIDGRGKKKDKKKDNKKPQDMVAPASGRTGVSASQAAAAALSSSQHAASMPAKGRGIAGVAGGAASGGSSKGVDPVTQASAAAQLLAEAAVSCSSPEQAAAAAAAAEAARRAAEFAAGAARGGTSISSSAPGAATANAAGRQQQRAGGSAPTRPLLAGWEPTPMPEGQSPFAGMRTTDAASRALDGLAGLESLLAGLRSEFAADPGGRWDAQSK